MPDRFVDDLFRRFTWRMLSNGVPAWDFEQIRKETDAFDTWCHVWTEWAERHRVQAEEALAAGRRAAAGQAFVRAGLFHHWAGFMFTHDLAQFRASLAAMAECWQRAAPLVDPPMELVSVPFEGADLPGYLRKPPGVERPPVVVLVPGADSTKEELYDLAEHIVARGVAVLAFDGPGHGPVSLHLKLRSDYEAPLRAVVDYVAGRADLDGERIAAGGISWGGHFACRAAATDPRVRAAVSMSGAYSGHGRWEELGEISQRTLRHYAGPDAPALLERITLSGLAAAIRVPLLLVYGGRDKGVPPWHAEQIAAEARGPVTLRVFPEGVHVCNNLHYLVRPLVADWLAATLQGANREAAHA